MCVSLFCTMQPATTGSCFGPIAFGGYVRSIQSYHDASDEMYPSAGSDIELEDVVIGDGVELVLPDRSDSRKRMEDTDHDHHQSGERSVSDRPRTWFVH